MPDRALPRPILALTVATAGGLGRLHPAPGTWGSLGGLALGIPAVAAGWQVTAVLGCLTLAATLAGAWASGQAARHLGDDDPSQVVIDEVAGQLLALACIPSAVLVASPAASTILAFLAFRSFDIVKPWPIRALERLPGGWGIMADDLAAGLCAGLATTACLS